VMLDRESWDVKAINRLRTGYKGRKRNRRSGTWMYAPSTPTFLYTFTICLITYDMMTYMS